MWLTLSSSRLNPAQYRLPTHTNVYLKLASRSQFLAKRSIILHSNRYRMSLKSCCETNWEHTGEILKVGSIRWNIKTLSVIMDDWLAALLKHTIAAHCRPCHSLLRFEHERNNICVNIFGSWSLVTDVIADTFKAKCFFLLTAQQIQGQAELIPHSAWSHICHICLQRSAAWTVAVEQLSVHTWFVLFCTHFGYLSYNNWFGKVSVFHVWYFFFFWWPGSHTIVYASLELACEEPQTGKM